MYLLPSFAMSIASFHELFLHDLSDMYSAEKQILKALPKMIKAAANADLKAGFEEHLEQTEEHVARLDTIFASLDESPKHIKCAGMAGLLEEGEEILKEKKKAPAEVIDAALICAAQKVEHYEIVGYGSLRTFAEMMKHDDAAALLQTTLDEEGATDKKLTALAESQVNADAMVAASGM